MARPRSFDEQEVLAQARDVFWTRGYTATSVSDLERATGLVRTSLYQAFGDKRRLFDRVLAEYQAWAQGELARITREAGDLRTAAAALFGLAVATARADRARGEAARGCLIANATCELSAVDEDALAFVAANREAFAAALLPVARRDPGLATAPEAAVDLAFAPYSGLNLLAKSGASPAELERAADAGLASFGAPASRA